MQPSSTVVVDTILLEVHILLKNIEGYRKEPSVFGEDMENMKSQLTALFAERAKRVSKPNQNKLIDLSRMKRAEWFRDYQTQYLYLEQIPYPNLTASIYRVSAGNTHAIFALYETTKLLWLDDDQSDEDFRTFFQLENLQSWIERQFSQQLAELLVNTKFAFLFSPQLLRSLSELSRVTDEEQVKLEQLTQSVHPPLLRKLSEGSTELSFYIWTKEFGMIVAIRCLFNDDNNFEYDGSILVTAVGNYGVVR